MSERTPGWYWVKFPDNNSWEPAEYLSNGNWCLLCADDEAAAVEVGPRILPPAIRALASPEKVTAPTPSEATERLKAYRPLADVARGPAGLALGADGIEQDGAPPPAASDLRDLERVILAYHGHEIDQNDIDPDSADAASIERIVDLVATIRAEARAGGWEDAVKALRNSDVVHCVGGKGPSHAWAGAADWLAVNKPKDL